MGDFSGKTILVTGGGPGIGRAISQAFTAAGAELVDRQADVTSQSDVDDLVRTLPALDIVVNCAGIIHRDAEYDMPTFLRVLDVNLSGVMRICTTCKPLLARSRGSIVNIASV